MEDINESGEYELTTFLSLIKEKGLDQLLDREGIFTMFVPIDMAFEQTMVK